MSKSFSANDVKEHSTVEKGLYIIIDGGVYEMGGTSPLFSCSICARTNSTLAQASSTSTRAAPRSSSASAARTPASSSGRSVRLAHQTPRDTATHTSAQYHNEGILKKYQPKLKIGDLKEGAKL